MYDFIVLGWLGGQPAEGIFVTVSSFFTFFYFFLIFMFMLAGLFEGMFLTKVFSKKNIFN
jgi:hypothetical protein